MLGPRTHHARRIDLDIYGRTDRVRVTDAEARVYAAPDRPLRIVAVDAERQLGCLRHDAVLRPLLLVLVEEAGEVAEDAFPIQPPEQRLACDAGGFGLVTEPFADFHQRTALLLAPRLIG